MVFVGHHSNLEFNMYSAAAVAIQEEVRGVYCAYCGIPVRLSAGLLRREAMLREESSPQQQLQTRVFPAGVDPAEQKASTRWIRSWICRADYFSKNL
jgi:hypothetical protein